ncbi:MAG: O-antigen ligase family protein [bacterium]|nr:MAG: O-antigen ligase family protein [bacterium]
MKFEIFGIPLRLHRVLIALIPLAGIVVIALLVLPRSALRLVAMGCIVLPIGMVFFDRPKWIFYAMFFILFSTIDVFAPVRVHIYLMAFFVVSFTVAVLNGRRIVYHDPTFIALVAAFVILAVQSIIVAGDVDASFTRLSQFAKWLVNVAIAVQFIRDRREFRILLLVMAVGIVVSNYLPFFVDIPEQYSSLSLIWGQGVLRYEGFVFEPNLFAGLQIFFIPILLYFVFIFKKPFIARPVLLVLVGGSIFLIFLTFSRGGFVGIIALLLLLLVIERRNKPILAVGLVCIAAVLIMAPAIYWNRIKSLLDISSKVTEDYSIASRLETMKVAMILGFKNPLFGVGLDNFLHQSTHYVPFRQAVHNPFLQVFCEMGVPGLLVFIAIIAHNIRVIRRLMCRRDDPEAAQVGRFLLLQQLAVLANGMFIPVAFESTFWFALSLPSMAAYAYRRKPLPA